MVQAVLKPLTFEEFVAWYPDNGRYELIDGIASEMQPTGLHEDVTEAVATALTLEVSRLKLPCKLPRHALIKAPSWNTGQGCFIVTKKCSEAASPRW